MFPATEFSRTPVSSRLITGLVSRERLILPALLVFYVAIVLIGSSAAFKDGDESGYAAYAMRIAHVGQSLDLQQWWGTQDPRYWWGPGYPLVLAPFALLGGLWLPAKLLNAFFLVGALAYAGAVVRKYHAGPLWLGVTVVLGLYPAFLRGLPSLNPESLMVLLVCGFMFHFCTLFQGSRRFRFDLVAASMYLAYLALTQIFFGYVIAAILGFLLIWRVCQRRYSVRPALRVVALAFLWCVPFLLYMHSVTGKVLYWGTSGGSTLYWISSPHPGEYGSWFSSNQVRDRSELAPHQDFFASLEGLTDVERDAALKREAIRNIKSHPKEYARNWAANVGRLLFSYPFSFTAQTLTTYVYLVPNIFIIVLFLVSLVPALRRRQIMPFEWWFLLAFALVAFAGFTLISGYDRNFRPLVEILCVWVALVSVRVLRIELRPVASHAERTL